MYLDTKRVLLGVVALVISIVLWWSIRKSNEFQQELIEEVEMLGEPEMPVSKDPVGDLKTAIKTAREQFDKGAYDEAIASIQKAWPAFEVVYYNQKDFLVDGIPIQDWFGQQRPGIEPIFSKPYQQMVDQLIQGNISRRDVDDYIKGLPSLFSRSLDKRFREEREMILEERAALAPNWIFLNVGASMRYSMEYEDAITPIILERIPEDFGYKIITTGTMDSREDSLAARSISFYMEGEDILYSENPDLMGGHSVVQSVKLELIDRTRNKAGLKLSWDNFEPIVVEHDLPEQIVFELENERQTVSFESIREQQRKALIQLLVAELQQDLAPLQIISESK